MGINKAQLQVYSLSRGSRLSSQSDSPSHNPSNKTFPSCGEHYFFGSAGKHDVKTEYNQEHSKNRAKSTVRGCCLGLIFSWLLLSAQNWLTLSIPAFPPVTIASERVPSSLSMIFTSALSNMSQPLNYLCSQLELWDHGHRKASRNTWGKPWRVGREVECSQELVGLRSALQQLYCSSANY